MFIDEVTITVEAGAGGNGCLSFRREKYVPRGGPDGGDGGKGGDVVLVTDESVSTLLAFRYQRLIRAVRGRHGEGSNKTGRSGEDHVIRVPPGTLVLDAESGQLLADLPRPGLRFVAAAGGRGGRGNARFATSRNRAPRRHEPGEPGETRTFRLELKLLADVGLVGFPNAGKSTLISRISAARPKIADYPFTTLEPSLGVVDAGDYRSFTVADIPGLIENAHRGAGLGHRFLRHIERTRILLHLVDAMTPDRDPVEGIETMNRELEMYSTELMRKPQIVVLTKSDVVPADSIAAVRAWAAKRDLACLVISAVTGDGIPELIHAVRDRLDRLPSPAPARRPTAILGGSFDPVHSGHLHVAEWVRRVFSLDEVVLVPCATPAIKTHALSSVEHRVAMLRLAIEGKASLSISTIELDRGGVSYTIETLRAIVNENLDVAPLFVVGMDWLPEITSWRGYQELLAEFDLVAVDRPAGEIERTKTTLDDEIAERIVEVPGRENGISEFDGPPPGSGGRIFHIAIPPMDVSSSVVRTRIAEGASLAGLVPPGVARYIQEHGLYQREGSS
ncbi:MAG: GTPase ObgE [Acidobacteriota bacterium]|nr:GTPase ObgE [Acidobacteriota bacterium]